MSITARTLHGINTCLIPLPDNDHRPLVLRHRPLAWLSALLVISKVLALGVISLIPAQAELSTITVNRIVQLTNAEREKADLPALAVNAKLAAAAQEKGQHMLAEDYFAHISPSGVTPWFWISKAGYSYLVAGENLAIDFTEAEDVVAAWIASPSHQANMLNAEYTETGVAVVSGEFEGSTSIIVVHMFGKPPFSSVPAKAQPTATPAPKPSSTPQPSATPSPAPAPVPIPSVPPADTTPPRVPRIALAGPSNIVGNTVSVRISGDTDTTAHILINNQLQTSADLTAGNRELELALDSLPDGSIELQVYGTDSAGNKSFISEPLVVEKDTQSPVLPAEDFRFFISPAFDAGELAFFMPAGEFESIRIQQQNDVRPLTAGQWAVLPATDHFTIEVTDSAGNTAALNNIAVTPQFEVDDNIVELEAPARLAALTRRLTTAIAVVLVVLLAMAVLIHIRIQRPALIAHASLVIFLAGLLLLL